KQQERPHPAEKGVARLKAPEFRPKFRGRALPACRRRPRQRVERLLKKKRGQRPDQTPPAAQPPAKEQREKQQRQKEDLDADNRREEKEHIDRLIAFVTEQPGRCPDPEKKSGKPKQSNRPPQRRRHERPGCRSRRRLHLVLPRHQQFLVGGRAAAAQRPADPPVALEPLD